MSMEIPNINEEKGEQIKEGMYKKVVESTDHKESDLGYIKNKEDRKTIVNNYSIEGDGGDLYELSEKIDEIYSAQEVEKKEYTGRELYSEVSPIKKNGEEILPYEVARAMVEGKALDTMDSNWLKFFLDHLSEVYQKGLEQDAKEIESAGGKDKWIKREAKRICEETDWDGWGKDANKKYQLQSMEENIASNWEEMGPQGWHEAVRAANVIMGTKEHPANKRKLLEMYIGEHKVKV